MDRSSEEGWGGGLTRPYCNSRSRPFQRPRRSTLSLTGLRCFFLAAAVIFCSVFPLTAGIITETIVQHSTEKPRSLSTYKLQVISARCQAYCNEKNGVQNQTTTNDLSGTYRPFLCKTDIMVCQECSTICNTSYSKLDQCNQSCTSDQCLDTCGVLHNISEEEVKSPDPVFANVQSLNLSVTAPVAACLYTPMDYLYEGSSVVLQWNVLNSSGQPSADQLTFVIEVYEENPSSGQLKDWRPLGYTNYSIMPIANLNPSSVFKFRVSVVSSAGLVAPPVTSDLIHLPKAGLPQAPTNISVRQYMSDQILMAEVKWKVPNNVGCYFKLYCSTPSQKSYIYKELREWVDYRYELFNLTFDSNYTLEIQTYYRHFVPGNASARVVHPFNTPNCLKSTNYSYTACPPEAPQQFEFKVHEPYIVNDTKVTNVTLSWRPPRHMSDTNPIEKYMVVWRKDPDIRYINQIKADRGAKDLSSNVTEWTMPDVHWDAEYVVTVAGETKNREGEKASIRFVTGAGYSLLIEEDEDSAVVATQLAQPSENVYFATIIPAILTAGSIAICAVYFVKLKKQGHHMSSRNSSRREQAINLLYECSSPKQQPTEVEPLIVATDEYEVDYSCLKLTITLGEGAFGRVMKAEFTPPGYYQGKLGPVTRTVAVKMLKEHATPEERRFLLLEIGTMKILGNHPNLVSIVACITNSTRPCLIMDYCPLGDLRNYLRQHRSKVSYITSGSSGIFSANFSNPIPSYSSSNSSKETEVVSIDSPERKSMTYEVDQNLLSQTTLLSYARQIAQGMEYLNQNRFIHRDLAARNILMVSQKCIKISDFGLSRDVYETNAYQPTSARKLPFKWMPIESIFDQVFTIKSDVWSYGILLWEIVTLGGCPYPGVPNCDLFRLLSEGYRLERPNNCSPDIYKIMLACWHPCIDDRPTFTQLKKKIESLLEASCSYIDLTKEVSADYYRSDSSDELGTEFTSGIRSISELTSSMQQDNNTTTTNGGGAAASNGSVLGPSENHPFRHSKRYSRFDASTTSHEEHIAQVCSYYPVSKGPYVLETSGPVPGLSEELLHKALSSVDLARSRQEESGISRSAEDCQISAGKDGRAIQTVSGLVDSTSAAAATPAPPDSCRPHKNSSPAKSEGLAKSKGPAAGVMRRGDMFGMDIVYPNAKSQQHGASDAAAKRSGAPVRNGSLRGQSKRPSHAPLTARVGDSSIHNVRAESVDLEAYGLTKVCIETSSRSENRHIASTAEINALAS